MEQSSSFDEETVRHQFDRKCKLALKGETVDYDRHMDYLRQHEIMLSELAENGMNNLLIINEYDIDICHFQILGYDIKVRDIWLVEALKALTERKAQCDFAVVFPGHERCRNCKKAELG